MSSEAKQPREDPLSSRGTGWVVAQGVLLATSFILAMVFREHDSSRHRNRASLARLTGLVAMMVSAGVALRAAMVVGRHISPFPKPATGAVLRQHDVYGVVRHPMYSAVIIGTAGWAMFWRSRPGLLSIPPLALFFRLKSRHEERMLAATFPDYDEYMQRVPALIPRLGTRHR